MKFEVAKGSKGFGGARARLARRAWFLVASMILISSATPSSYGLEFPMTSLLSVPDVKKESALIAADEEGQSDPDQQVAALYASFDFNTKVTAIDLRAVSFAARQIELARTPSGAKAVAIRIIRTEYKRWNETQQQCLVKLWTRESHWNYKAHNYRSGAHGIPQAYPAIKMESMGSDWRTNPVTQIRWGLNYIDKRYKSPCKALARHSARNTY